MTYQPVLDDLGRVAETHRVLGAHMSARPARAVILCACGDELRLGEFTEHVMAAVRRVTRPAAPQPAPPRGIVVADATQGMRRGF
jgi:hypothetical protein